MSKFFEALERAAQEQAFRHHPAPSTPRSEQGPTIPEPVPYEALRPSPEGPRTVPDGLDEHLVSLIEPASFEAEQYRALRQLVERLHKSTALSIVAVSSPTVAEGKTTTSINLAGALAQAPDARVLLVDADLRGAALAPRLGFDEYVGPGLVDAIVDANLTLPAVVHALPSLNLSVVPAGRFASAPYEVLKSPRFGELLAEARKRYDYIILDTPPLVSVPDCRVIEKWVDGFLIVVTAHRTARKLLEEALNVTERARIVGLVFNGDDRHLSRDSYGAYDSRQSARRNGGGWRRRVFGNRDRIRRRQVAPED